MQRNEIERKDLKNVEEGIASAQRGITLIALVITIIVLLILAGVTINLTLGQNGIFKTAEQAARNYKEAEEKEVGQIENFTNTIDKTVNSIENNYELFGTIVKIENNINCIADGIGNIIPVPAGFAPISLEEGQGTKSTGFVIRNEKDNNEFVWVPVEGMDYTYNRYDLKNQRGEYSDYSETIPEDEEASVATYGGYYIGRYEAGIEGGTLTSESNLSSSKNWTGWTAENDKEMKLVVKPGAKVWNCITRNKAKEVAEGLYKKEDDNVKSKLCSSYSWDTALKFIETQNNTYLTISKGGNYGIASGGTGKIADTGYDKTHPCNIYDMGGNVWEWTTEDYRDVNTTCTRRGGDYNNGSKSFPATSRYYNPETFTHAGTGFRVTLFM